MSSLRYVEDKSFLLPYLENGPTSIGALWDCQTSTTVHGFNLFGNVPGEDHVKVDEIHAADYTLRHVKSTSDRQKTLQVGGEVSLEILDGMIKVGGSADYEETNATSLSEEELLCTYDLTTCSVETLPSVKETINHVVLENILNGATKATHVVVATQFGAKLSASIRIKETETTSNQTIKGSFFGKIILGPVTASAKVYLGMLDTTRKDDFENTIKVASRPNMSMQPQTIEEMFNMVTMIHDEIFNHVALKTIDKTVYGVPIRFTLVPINQFIEVPVERLYLQFKDTMLETLTSYLTFLKDFQVYPYLHKKVLEAEPALKMVLYDPENPLTQRIIETEECYRSKAKSAFTDLGNLLREYKVGKTDSVAILETIHELEEDVSMTVVFESVGDFVREGRELLLTITNADIEDSHKIEIFTNSLDLERWYQASKPIKILLRTGNTGISSYALATIYGLSKKLHSIGIKVGVALPNISDNQNSLALKINGDEVVYATDESIKHVVQVLTLLADEAGQIATRFFTIYASLSGIKLPFTENLDDLHSLISILEKAQAVTIAESYLQTRDLCLEMNEDTKFMINLEALDSALDSVKKHLYLQHVFEDSVKWIVGKWEFEEIQGHYDSPIVFAFQNGKLIGLCCDIIDALFIHNALTGSAEESKEYLDLIQPTETNLEKNTFHKDRATFALNFAFKFHHRSSVLDYVPAVKNLPGFQVTLDQNYISRKRSQELLRAAVSKNWNDVYSILKELIFQENDVTEEVQWAIQNMYNEDTEQLICALQNLLESQSPFYSMVSGILETIKSIGSKEEDMSTLNDLIDGVVSHEKCPESLAEQLQFLEDVPSFSEKVTKVIGRLENYLLVANSDPTLEYIAKFIALLKAPSETEMEAITSRQLIPGILSQIKILDVEYPGAANYLQQCTESKNLYGSLHVLTAILCDPCLYRVRAAFESLPFTNNTKSLGNIMVALKNENFTEEQYESIFGNRKIQLILKNASSSNAFLEKLKCFIGINGVQNYLPSFLREKLEPLCDLDEEEETKLFETLENTLSRFYRICQRDKLPENFAQTLMDSWMSNVELYNIFSDAGALLYWDECNNQFVEAWNCTTVKAAYDKLREFQWKQDAPSDNQLEYIQIQFLIPPQQPPDEIQEEQKLPECLQGTIAHQLIGNMLDPISPAYFLMLSKLLPQPNKLHLFDDGYMSNLVPYILQRVKMWGLQAIRPEHLCQYFITRATTSDPSNPAPRLSKKLNFKSQTGHPSSTNIQLSDTKPISRMDLFAIFLARCHPLVFQDILKIVSQFSLALPLIVRDITEANTPTFKCLIPLLKTCTTKWEYAPGVVHYNDLFTSPFKMIVAIRVGSAPHGKPGKSSILNQVLSQRHMFSSLSSPGSKHGKPLTLDGSVEFCALTQETTSSMLWQSAVQPHYSTGTEQLLLLANLHGDVLQYPETLKVLKTFSSKFIIFFNSMDYENLCAQYDEIESHFEDLWSDHLYHVLIDPIDGCQDMCPDRVIETSQLVSDDTSHILRTVITEAIIENGCQDDVTLANLPKPEFMETVLLAPDIATKESQAFIDFVKRVGCRQVKASMKIQKMNPKLNAYYQDVPKMFNESVVLQELVHKFVSILRLPVCQRVLAISHLDREISKLTAEDSTKMQNRIKQLRSKIVHSMSLVKSADSDKVQMHLRKKLMFAFEELDEISLGLEHIYREVGRIFAFANQSSEDFFLSTLAASTGELLVNGNAVEVLDGELLDISKIWFDSVCHSICKKYENLKIFVVSILGLQSSGKSTLLNALFGCKFAVSAGRCTRGLFMRILFLEKDLAAELGVDALVILDTEGLGAPEKLNDEGCDQKDRQLATFTMSVSNLTLINVLGESFRDLSDILQVVVVAMARLEKADMSPDICMVQHLSERDGSKVMRGETEFLNALQEAVILTEKRDMKMGIRNTKSLQVLEQRIRNGDLAKLFPPFKNGGTVNAPPSEKYHEAVIDLYEMIMDTIKKTVTKPTFHGWHEIIHSYWAEVLKQDLVLGFKNIKEIQDFIDRGTLIASAKSAIDDSFRAHRETFHVELRARFNQFLSEKEENPWIKIQKEFVKEADEGLRMLPFSCPTSCEKCAEAWNQRIKVFNSVEGKAGEQETHDSLYKHIKHSRLGILKNLNQMADALVVTHGNCAEFDDIVANIIQERLKVKRRYAESEVDDIIDQTWKKLRQHVSTKMKVEPVLRKILDEILIVYDLHSQIERRVRDDDLPDLGNIVAFRNLIWSNCLEFKDVQYLQHELEQITDGIIAKYGSKHFENGMVRSVSEEIQNILSKFESDVVKTKLRKDFKWAATVFALIKFTRVMQENEEEWNEQYNPNHILKKREDEYRKKIKIWLVHGFGYESEGSLIAEKLHSAIRQLAQKQGDDELIKFVSGHTWLISSENVRLEYFVDLAKEIQGGNKRRALNHFSSPKDAITNWFNTRVNGLARNNAQREFIKTATSEFERTTQAIRNINSAEALREFVQNYLTLADGVEYNPQSGLDFAEATEAEFNIFKSAVLRKLADDQGTICVQDIQITDPSRQEKIQKILGCCEHCYWCGALCWGEFDHKNNEDDTKRHHACHQSLGLKAVKHRTNRTLIVESCDCVGDDWTMYWPSCPDGIPWQQTKLRPDFVGWIFTAHSKNDFNDLMKWFFANLHNDIATAKGFKPAPSDDLHRLGFSSLPSLNHITSIIESRLGKH